MATPVTNPSAIHDDLIAKAVELAFQDLMTRIRLIQELAAVCRAPDTRIPVARALTMLLDRLKAEAALANFTPAALATQKIKMARTGLVQE